jgi:hypothetical protein
MAASGAGGITNDLAPRRLPKVKAALTKATTTSRMASLGSCPSDSIVSRILSDSTNGSPAWPRETVGTAGRRVSQPAGQSMGSAHLSCSRQIRRRHSQDGASILGLAGGFDAPCLAVPERVRRS